MMINFLTKFCFHTLQTLIFTIMLNPFKIRKSSSTSNLCDQNAAVFLSSSVDQ